MLLRSSTNAASRSRSILSVISGEGYAARRIPTYTGAKTAPSWAGSTFQLGLVPARR